MKKIYAQKGLFLYMNLCSMCLLAFGLYAGIAIDRSFFNLLLISLGFSALSLLFLINKIYYDEHELRFSFVAIKTTVKYEDIKEIFTQKNLLYGVTVVFNLDKPVSKACSRYLEYHQLCKKENIKNCIFFSGVSKKNLKAILKHCNCNKMGVHY